MTVEGKKETIAERLGAKETMRGVIFDPSRLFVVGLDGESLGLTPADEARIAALPESERPAALAPFRVAWLKDQFRDHPNALATIDALIDDRATQPLDPGFVASCSAGVHEPVIATHLGALRTGEPCVAIVEGRHRCRSLRLVNADRAAEKPPLPSLSLTAIVRSFSSPRIAREVKIVTASHVALSPIQRAQRAQELLDQGIAPVDVAPLVGLATVASLKQTLALLKQDAAVQQAVASGAVTVGAAREMHHLSPAEQRARIEQIAASGARGKKAREIARTGTAGGPRSNAPPRSVVEACAKRLAGSNDPLLNVAGIVLTWATSGVDAGLDRVPGLREILHEELTRNHGEPLDPATLARLRARVEASGGAKALGARIGAHEVTVAKALAGGRVRQRVRTALLRVLDEPAGETSACKAAEPLTEGERDALTRVVEASTRKAVARELAIMPMTLERALAGGNVAPETASAIRALLAGRKAA